MFKKISQNFIKSSLNFCLILQILVHAYGMYAKCDGSSCQANDAWRYFEIIWHKYNQPGSLARLVAHQTADPGIVNSNTSLAT